ncbi:NACHT domain protein [Nonomuraea coxensis DSM 45129]|uniref:NACHT domain protein n=1 Tax=Nonomuraea coxensis DSM 45129 TaxID=1122611 RepID=A0ABX8U307_9ACTN|nr:NACHT domain-containing protein [Nonomuraea coxensis]QYC42126.1 NACHT domain protein [Nonomuraea coxensis DSM 45129]
MDTSQLLPYGGALLALFVVLWLLDKFTGGIVEELGKRALDHLLRGPRRPALGRRALGRYAKLVRHTFGTHTMGFRAGDAPVTVEEVYVPLHYESGGSRLDMERLVLSRDRVVVLGEPGAGKSMLLKHLMLGWADDPRRDRRVPILIDLHRYGRATLRDLLAETLGHGRGPIGADRLHHALTGGRLRLFFDGLDEVARDHQSTVLGELRELASRYERCPMVVTCRESVYKGALAAEFGAPVVVADLDDASLRVLLRHLVKDDVRAHCLIAALSDTRPVLELARSPMLLTMTSYLFLEGVFGEQAERLPRSRAGFYELAIRYLLGRDTARGLDAMTRFEPDVKLVVLRRLALSLMNQDDGRTVGHRDLVALIRTEAADLLQDAQAERLIDELVDRSRLLVRLWQGGGRSYVFRHLTLQEYLAAVELAGRGEELLGHYRRAPALWQEVVRLWCSIVPRDCTWLLRELYADPRSRVLVLRCLAEAEHVEPAFADDVIVDFVAPVSCGIELPGPALRALGALAAVGNTRGDQVLAQLMGSAQADYPAIYHVLAASGRREALDRLLEAADTSTHARGALRAMGDLAVPELKRVERAWAIDELGRIGTPAAAEALTELTDHIRAVWWLAALLNSEDVRTALSFGESPGGTSWISRPYRGDWPPRLCAIIESVVGQLRANDEAIPPDLDLPPVFPPVALAVLAHDDLIGSGNQPLPVSQQEEQALHWFERAGMLPPGLRKRSMSEQVYRGLAAITADHAGNARLHRAALHLAGFVVRNRPLRPATSQCLAALDWTVLAAVAGRLDRPWGGRQRWSLLGEERPEPRLLRRLLTTGVTLGALFTAGTGIYGAMRSLLGQGTWGPVWLAIVTVTAVVATVVGVITISSGFGAWVLFPGVLVSSACLIAYSGATLNDWLAPYGPHAGWTAYAVAGLALASLGAYYFRLKRRWANPFRQVLAQCSPHCLPASFH